MYEFVYSLCLFIFMRLVFCLMCASAFVSFDMCSVFAVVECSLSFLGTTCKSVEWMDGVLWFLFYLWYTNTSVCVSSSIIMSSYMFLTLMYLTRIAMYSSVFCIVYIFCFCFVYCGCNRWPTIWLKHILVFVCCE